MPMAQSPSMDRRQKCAKSSKAKTGPSSVPSKEIEKFPFLLFVSLEAVFC
jgi:hypothetical protein